MPRVIFKVRDGDGDTQQFSFPALAGSGVTFGAQETQFNNLEAALANIIVGVIALSDYSMLGTETAGNAATPLAQTNIQWVAVWSDTVTGAVRKTRIGTADLTLLPLGSTQLSAGAEYTAFKTAFDLVVRSELGNPASLLRLEYVE